MQILPCHRTFLNRIICILKLILSFLTELSLFYYIIFYFIAIIALQYQRQRRHGDLSYTYMYATLINSCHGREI